MIYPARSNPASTIPPEVRGALAETALTGLFRHPWSLLAPPLHRLVDEGIHSFTAEHSDEEGPPRPMPGGEPVETAAAALHSMINAFHSAPFTLQRLCEVLLEPRKQYNRVDKLLLALERLLSVTTTLEPAREPPPRPALSMLGPVNENPPSPYAGQPPAGPLSQHAPEIDSPILVNGIVAGEDYPIFVGAEAGMPLSLNNDEPNEAAMDLAAPATLSFPEADEFTAGTLADPVHLHSTSIDPIVTPLNDNDKAIPAPDRTMLLEPLHTDADP